MRREPDAAVPLVALVGDQLRHRWFVSQLAADPGLDLRGVVCEAKRPAPVGETPEQDELIASHLAERAEAEERFFGEAPPWDSLGAAVLGVDHGGSNSQEVAAWVRAREPHALALFGCSIIREPLLSEYENRVVNTHLGLSPYYRGAATNFWPLVNGEPECVGTTIHLATPRVDGGPIARQVRPQMAPDDGPHDIGCRAVASGSAALRDALVALAGGELEPRAQSGEGRLYRNADFGADAVAELRRRFAAGMIPDYLERRLERDSRFPIVE